MNELLKVVEKKIRFRAIYREISFSLKAIFLLF